MSSIQQQIVDLIKQNQKILIMPSSPPDGDSIGSALALYLALKKLNKEVTVVCPESVPDTYHFLPATHVIGDRVVASKDFIITIDSQKIKIENIKTINEDDKVNIIITPVSGRMTEGDVHFNYGPERYDLIITVDTGGLEQLGHLYTDHVDMFHQIPVINIDHHASNEHFGKINYVDIMAPATTELLIGVLENIEKDTGIKVIDEDIATLLLAGIITDTGSFQNANTSPRAFDSSARLVSYGARQQEIIQHIFKTKQLSMLKLWGRILTKMQIDEKYNIVWSVLTRKDFQDTGSDESETGGIIDELLTNAPGAEIICLLKERKDGMVSASIRTTTASIDASAFAEKFGGGGHVQAAGFRVQTDSAEKIEKQILQVFREYQAERLGKPQEEEQSLISPPIKKVDAPVKKIEPPAPRPIAAPVPAPRVAPVAPAVKPSEPPRPIAPPTPPVPPAPPRPIAPPQAPSMSPPPMPVQPQPPRPPMPPQMPGMVPGAPGVPQRPVMPVMPPPMPVPPPTPRPLPPQMPPRPPMPPQAPMQTPAAPVAPVPPAPRPVMPPPMPVPPPTPRPPMPPASGFQLNPTFQEPPKDKIVNPAGSSTPPQPPAFPQVPGYNFENGKK
jgi:nanoRNase/pAp phosphatase (c-di-AMP/oligoRNAs hydrolase)